MIKIALTHLCPTRPCLANSIVYREPEILILDFEFNNKRRITEIGALEVQGDQVLSSFHRFIPNFNLEDTSKLTPSLVSFRGASPTSYSNFKDLIKFIGDRPIVSHNSSVEISLLLKACRNLGVNTSNLNLNDTFCTLRLARILFPDANNHQLKTLLYHTESTMPDKFHRAINDCLATTELWCKIRKTLKKRYNIPDHKHFELLRALHCRPTREAERIIKRSQFNQPL